MDTPGADTSPPGPISTPGAEMEPSARISTPGTLITALFAAMAAHAAARVMAAPASSTVFMVPPPEL